MKISLFRSKTFPSPNLLRRKVTPGEFPSGPPEKRLNTTLSPSTPPGPPVHVLPFSESAPPCRPPLLGSLASSPPYGVSSGDAEENEPSPLV